MEGSTCSDAERGALAVEEKGEGEIVSLFLLLLFLLFPSLALEGDRTTSMSLRAIPWRLWLGETATRERCSEQPLRKARR